MISMSLWTIFTFHYVSISTGLRQPTAAGLLHLHSTMYLFQHTGRGPKEIPQYNLHSTMYLFQHVLKNSQITRYPIYIPLCIYFNASSMTLTITQYAFTFHYVSISTFSFTIWFTKLRYLHSTMYLFQPLSESDKCD